MKTMPNILLTCLVAVIASLATVHFSKPQNASEIATEESVYDRVIKSGKIRCGYLESPVFLNVNPNTGEKSGIAFDLMNQIAKNLGLSVEWTEEVGRANFIEGLKQDRFDAYCTAITMTAERSREIDFIEPYVYDTFDLYARIDDARFDKNITRVNSKDIKIVALEGDIMARIAGKFFPEAQLIQLPQLTPESDQFLHVETNKADIVISTPHIAAAYLDHNQGKLKKIDFGKPFIYANTSIGIKGDQYRFKRMLDATVAEMKANGQLDKILDKHDPKRYLNRSSLPF